MTNLHIKRYKLECENGEYTGLIGILQGLSKSTRVLGDEWNSYFIPIQGSNLQVLIKNTGKKTKEEKLEILMDVARQSIALRQPEFLRRILDRYDGHFKGYLDCSQEEFLELYPVNENKNLA